MSLCQREHHGFPDLPTWGSSPFNYTLVEFGRSGSSSLRAS